MTCVVAIEHMNKVHMGADSCMSTLDTKVTTTSSKIFVKDNILFGFAGSFRFADILQHHTTLPKHSKNLNDKEYLIGIVVKRIHKALRDHEFIRETEVIDDMSIIGYNGKLYCLSSDFSLTQPACQYISIGSGTSAALGSLYTTKELKTVKVDDRLRLALRAASEHSQGVSAPYNFLSI